MFEVDHPATQEWKRGALARAGMREPDEVVFVPADLTTQPLVPRLRAAGFDAAAPAVVSWLGVTMYLTPDEIARTLTAIRGFAPGTDLIADYMLPEPMRDEAGAVYGTLLAPALTERGEPWLSAFTPDQFADLALRCGFADGGRHVGQRDTIPAWLWTRADSLRPADLAVLFHGTVPA